MTERPTALRGRMQEISAEYWEARASQTEHVAVAQLALALARIEVENARLREALIEAPALAAYRARKGIG